MRRTIVLASLLAACSGPDEPPPVRLGPASSPSESTSGDDAGAGSRPTPPASSSSDPFEVWRRREPIYELYVRHFSPAGNFKGVEAKLAELKALGIGIVWLLPINEIGSIAPANGGPGTDAPWGNPYAVKSYERINPEYGSDADLRDLVTKAHALGMRVLVDWVPNHTAWDNPLVTEHPDWYVRQNGTIQPVREFAWIAQLDWSKQGLRDYMTNVMSSWVTKFDLDGFRIDYAHGMPVDFFATLRTELEKKKPIFLLAEAGDPSFHPAFDMTYDWDVYPLLGDVTAGTKTVSALDDALLYRQLVPYASTPDALVMRMTYNHDDNGNFTLEGRYRGGVKTTAVLACTLPGKPLVFDGQEVGMNVFDGTTVRRSINLGHDPALKIDWNDPDGFRPFYTKLLQLFRSNSALHHAGSGDFRKIHTSPADYPYAYIRRDAGSNAVLVILNLSPADLTAVVLEPTEDAGTFDGTYVDLFSGAQEAIHAGMSMHLKPWEYRVLVQGPLK